MQKCLYCGQEAKPAEVYQDTQLYECIEGHRTGVLKGIYIDPQEFSEDQKKLKVSLKLA